MNADEYARQNYPHLVRYGIHEENSDIRAHVSIAGKQIVVFPTHVVRSLIDDTEYRIGTATQSGVGGIVTGLGYLVPISDIEPLEIVVSASCPWWSLKQKTPSEKGEAAVKVVSSAIRSNKFPLWVCGIVTTETELDIDGTDITVNATRSIQVKHDDRAYTGTGGTGNVFIQTHECNPLKQH